MWTWWDHLDDRDKWVFYREAVAKILEDVRNDWQTNKGRGYIGGNESIDLKRLVHPLMKYGTRNSPVPSGTPDESLIKSLASSCSPWLFDPETVPTTDKAHLSIIERAFLRSAPKDVRRAIFQSMATLGWLLSDEDQSRTAWRLFVAFLIVADVMRLSFPEEVYKSHAQALYKMLERVYGKLKWDAEPQRIPDLLKKRMADAVISILKGAWEEDKERPRAERKRTPREVDYFRTAYRLGLLFRTEKPFDELHPDANVADLSLRRRFEKRKQRASEDSDHAALQTLQAPFYPRDEDD